MKTLGILGLALSFNALAEIKIIDDYVVSDVPIESYEHLLNYCASYGKSGIQRLTPKEFNLLRRHPNHAELTNLISTDGENTHSISKRRTRRIPDHSYVGTGPALFAVCKGAKNYSKSELIPRDAHKAPENAKSFDLVGMDLRGSIKSELNAGPSPSHKGNIEFKTFIADRIISEHHKDSLNDKEHRKYLRKHYIENINTPNAIGSLQLEVAAIEELTKNKQSQISSPVKKALLNKYEGKLEQINIKYEIVTGRMVEIVIYQYVDLLARNMPNIAEKLSEKWGVKAFEVRGTYEFNLTENMQCVLRRASASWLSSRSSNNVMKITCTVIQPYKYLYEEEPKIKSFVNKLINSPPKPPKFGKDVLL